MGTPLKAVVSLYSRSTRPPFYFNDMITFPRVERQFNLNAYWRLRYRRSCCDCHFVYHPRGNTLHPSFLWVFTGIELFDPRVVHGDRLLLITAPMSQGEA
jgi:hypothetical protein